MKTILTPVDFSSATARVVEAALELARAVEGRIVLLHVVQPPIVTSDYGLAMENVQEILAVSEKAAARQLSHLLDSLKAKGVEARVVQINGAAVSGILDSAAKLDADYIVMGSHGHTALYDLIVGSTTHGILKKAACPVLVVPPKKKGSKKRR
jgi:nucleotide-binding universal stress UspA family protein